MSNRHISSNIQLVLNLLDYSDYINSNALILFLDFYKAFDTVEHYFLFQTLQAFFGPKCYGFHRDPDPKADKRTTQPGKD